MTLARRGAGDDPVSGVYSAAELDELAARLSAVEDWLRESCTARHAGDMADVVGKAFQVIDDLCDDQERREAMARQVRELTP